jgi:hypothetical protein
MLVETQKHIWAALRRPRYKKTGGVLLSQALASQVPSALRGLTALFGMGRGVSPSLKPPEKGERPRPPQSFKTAQRHSEYHHPDMRHTRWKPVRVHRGWIMGEGSKKSVKPSTD